jgi:hypothetical protein
MKFKSVAKRITLIILFFSALFCHKYLLNFRLLMLGPIYPSNTEEKLIFDYFYALRFRNYDAAYRLLSPLDREDYSSFVDSAKRSSKELPFMISVRKLEGKPSKKGKHFTCESHYEVYFVSPDSYGVASGNITLGPRENSSNLCAIEYNSAFGPT